VILEMWRLSYLQAFVKMVPQHRWFEIQFSGSHPLISVTTRYKYLVGIYFPGPHHQTILISPIEPRWPLPTLIKSMSFLQTYFLDTFHANLPPILHRGMLGSGLQHHVHSA
jgi:hypothetical protein